MHTTRNHDLTPWLSALAGLALIAGIYGRFKGLGNAPLSVDEYYLTRSIDNILRHGLPIYDCGGYYTRGLLLQYSSAALRLSGLAPELAPRLLCALCSVLTLPAAFLLAQRAQGRNAALLTLTLLAVSVWEIEIGRFGRMYAPFQAVFVWYLVFFVRYTIDQERRALRWMIAMSVAAPFVWEGGVFLALLNLLPPFLQGRPARLGKSGFLYLAAMLPLLLLGVWFVKTDFRGFHALPWPAGYAPGHGVGSPDFLSAFVLRLPNIRLHSLWLVLGLLPIGAALGALRWVWLQRARPLVALGLLAMIVAALVHQFIPVAAIALLMLLMGWITWKELFCRPAALFHLAIATCALFWLAIGLTTLNWHGAEYGSTH
jgi:hypothetical protein